MTMRRTKREVFSMDPAHGQEKSASLGRRHPDPRQFGMKIPSLIRRQKSQIFYFRAQQKKRPAAFMLLPEKCFMSSRFGGQRVSFAFLFCTRQPSRSLLCLSPLLDVDQDQNNCNRQAGQVGCRTRDKHAQTADDEDDTLQRIQLPQQESLECRRND